MNEKIWLKKYQIIVNDLSQEIKSGVYLEHSCIPSELQIMKKYDVSRITARKALDTLVSMGIIYKVQGKGSFVSKTKKSHSLLKIHSYTEAILDAGMDPTRKILGFSFNESPLDIAEALNIKKGNQLFQLERVIYANDIALCLVKSSLPSEFFPNIEQYNFSKHSLYEILEIYYHTRVSHTELKIDVFSADEKVSKKMGVLLGTPLLDLSILAYGLFRDQEVPLEFSQSFYNPSVINYTISKTT